MVATRQARAGIPISVKLILATSIVVAAAVGVVTWFSQTSIADLTERQQVARRQSGEQEIQRGSVLLVQSIANTIAFPVANGMIPDIKPALDGALAEDRESGARRMSWLVLVDKVGDRFGTTGAPDQATLAAHDKLLADGKKTGRVVHAKIGGTDWVYRTPVSLLQGSPTGTLWMGVTTAGIEQELQASLDEARARAERTRDRIWLVSLVILAIGIVLAALQGVQLARPIKALTVQAHRIAGGDLETRVGENRRDELGVLARTFNVMADEIRALLVDQAHKASLEKEMSLARQVQQAMLPPETLDEHGAMKVIGYCMPASSCGGDWWTYRKLSNGRMLLVVGDATGHGIHSAMIAATARGAVEALSGIDERLLTPDQILRAIDSSIRQVGDHNVLMTAFAAVFDSMSGVLHYANAGQNFPYVIKLGPTRILEAASIIAASGNPLGDRNIPVEIRRGSLQLRPGDLFVCFTDGVVERANPQGKLFGDRRLRSALTGQSLEDGDALVRLRDLIVNTLHDYAEGTNAEDDITLVLCHYDPPAARISGRGAA
ncbi:MAG: SpoIIE family protein phosphatase [Kofleriaceae bacterium]